MTGYSAGFSMQANPQRARTLLADSRPASNLSYVLSYDPRDPQAQLIAERIALNARESASPCKCLYPERRTSASCA